MQILATPLVIGYIYIGGFGGGPNILDITKTVTVPIRSITITHRVIATQAENLIVIAEHVTTTTESIIPRVAVANVNKIGTGIKKIFCS
jgi:hypothetical protein